MVKLRWAFTLWHAMSAVPPRVGGSTRGRFVGRARHPGPAPYLRLAGRLRAALLQHSGWNHGLLVADLVIDVRPWSALLGFIAVYAALARSPARRGGVALRLQHCAWCGVCIVLPLRPP